MKSRSGKWAFSGAGSIGGFASDGIPEAGKLKESWVRDLRDVRMLTCGGHIYRTRSRLLCGLHVSFGPSNTTAADL